MVILFVHLISRWLKILCENLQCQCVKYGDLESFHISPFPSLYNKVAVGIQFMVSMGRQCDVVEDCFEGFSL